MENQSIQQHLLDFFLKRKKMCFFFSSSCIFFNLRRINLDFPNNLKRYATKFRFERKSTLDGLVITSTTRVQ